jgi:hypothetical protein
MRSVVTKKMHSVGFTEERCRGVNEEGLPYIILCAVKIPLDSLWSTKERGSEKCFAFPVFEEAGGAEIDDLKLVLGVDKEVLELYS